MTAHGALLPPPLGSKRDVRQFARFADNVDRPYPSIRYIQGCRLQTSCWNSADVARRQIEVTVRMMAGTVQYRLIYG